MHDGTHHHRSLDEVVRWPDTSPGPEDIRVRTKADTALAVAKFEGFNPHVVDEDETRITIQRRGTITLNCSAFVSLGAPVAVNCCLTANATWLQGRVGPVSAIWQTGVRSRLCRRRRASGIDHLTAEEGARA